MMERMNIMAMVPMITTCDISKSVHKLSSRFCLPVGRGKAHWTVKIDMPSVGILMEWDDEDDEKEGNKMEERENIFC